LFHPGPGRLVEDRQQGPGPPAGLEGGASRGRHARDRSRSGHDEQEPSGDAEADPLGLGDGGELILHVSGDLDGSLQAVAKGPILGLAVGELSPEVVDPSFGRRAIDGLDDLLGLAIERLAGLLPVPCHRGHVAILATEDGRGAGDSLGDRGPRDSLRHSQPRHHAHDCTRLDANCPPTSSSKAPF
jgi:hypothetical protein